MRSVSASLSTFLDTSTIGLYQHLVTITLADGTVLRWTDNESDLVVGGNTFTSGGTGTVPIVQIGGRTDSAGTEIGDLELTLLCGETARVAGVPIPAAVVADIFDRATVKVERVFGASAVDVSMGTMRLFDGVVAETDPSSTIVKLSLVDPRDELKIELPRTPIQPPCVNQVYDNQCDPDGTLKTNRTYGATVATGSTARVVRTNRAEASGYFDLGVLTFDSNTATVALRNVKRAVSSFAQTNGAFTLSEALPAIPVSGDSFIVHPGCNKHFLDSGGCAKFGNQDHFRGCPLLPAEASDGRRVAKVNPDFTSNVTEWNGISGNVTPPDLVLPLVYGRQKVKGQVVYRRDWDIHYTTLIVVFCEGPIVGTRRFWVGDTFSSAIPLAGGFSAYYPGNEPDVFRLGTRPTQAGWNWLGPAAGGVDPTYAGVHYPGIAYWAVKRRPLPAGATESYELEVDGFLSNASDSGKDGDAHPASILGNTTYGILKNSQYGAGFRWPVVTDLGSDYTAASSARRYLTAAGLYLSPIIDSRRKAIDILQEILESCNCSCRIADGALQIVPLGDIEFTQNGATYTPDTTVQYALDEDDFITNGTEDPVTVKRPSTEEVCNIIPVAWTERNPTVSPRQNSTSYNVGDWFSLLASDGKNHTYVVTVAGVSDSTQPSAYTGTWGQTIGDGSLQAVEKGVTRDSSYAYVERSLEDPEPVDVSVNGPRRGDAVSLPMVCLPEAALTISRLRAQRSVKRRNVYTFKLGWRFSRLQPLDYVRISDSKFNLVDVVVRIVSISENGDVLTIEAEDAPLGMSHAVAHTTQSSETTFAGVPWVEPARADFENVPAGSVTSDHIADGAVTGPKIAANVIDASKVQDAAITAAKIMAGVVDASKLADGAVTTVKIAGSAVDVTKLADGSVSAAKIVADAVTSSKIADSAVSAAKIADSAVSAAKIADGAVSAAKIAGLAVDVTKLADGSVSAAKIVTGAVGSGAIAAGAVVADKVAAGAIGANAIAANAIVAGKIAAGAVQASALAIAAPGSALNADPACADSSAWTGWGGYSNPTFGTVTDGEVGTTVMRNITGQTSWMNESKRIPVDPSKTYRVRGWGRTVSGTTGFFYLGVALFDAAGANITGDGSQWYYAASSVQPPSAWTEYYGLFGSGTAHPFPANARTMSPVLILNFSGGDRVLEVQDIRIEEVLPGTLIKDGSIVTAKIAAGAITANEIAADAITASKIAAGAVGADEIAAGAVVAGKIAADAVTANTIAASAVTAGKIAAGAVGANEIAANSITAKQLVLTDFTNLITNPNGDQYDSSYKAAGYAYAESVDAVVHCDGSLAAGSRALQLVDRDDYFGGWFPCKGGDEFWVSAEAWTSGSQYGGQIGIVSSLTPNFDGVLGWAGPSFAANTAGKQSISGAAAAHAAAKYIRLWVQEACPLGQAQPVYVRNVLIRRKANADLIVDGAVTADKIAANAITAGKIAAGELKTSNYAESGGVPTAGAKLDHTGTALKVAPGNLLLGNKTLDLLLGANINGAVMRVQRTAGGVLSCTAGWGHTGYKLTDHVDTSPEMVMISSPAAIRVVRCHLFQKWANGAVLLAFTTPTAQLVGSEVPLMVPVVVQPNYTSPGGPYSEYPYVDIAPRNPANGAWLDPATFAWEFALMVLAPGVPT